jgi:VanZ family protein
MVRRLWWTGRGDAIVNVLLFVPVGALGWLSVDASPRPRLQRAVLLLVASTTFAFALQVVQLWLPERTAALSDALWNAVGTAVGLPLAAVLRPWVDRLSRAHLLHHRAALLMGALWLAAQCWPLMPAHSLRHAWVALQPLVRGTGWSVGVVAETAAGLAIALALARDVRRRGTFALVLVAAAVCGKLLVRQLEITPSHALGWALGSAVGLALLRRPPGMAALGVGALALAGFTAQALLPWQWVSDPGAFHWVPMQAPLQHARVAHTLELVWAVFWLGALMLAAQVRAWNLARTALLLTLFVLALETAQRWQPVQTADITPVLIPLIWWWVWRRAGTAAWR